MRRTLTVAGVVAVVAAMSVTAFAVQASSASSKKHAVAASAVVHRDVISLSAAQKLATAAQADCEKRGFAVSVAVVDTDGVARASRHTLLAQLATQVSRLAVNVILARLLTPSDFGVVAVATLVPAYAAWHAGQRSLVLGAIAFVLRREDEAERAFIERAIDAGPIVVDE